MSDLISRSALLERMRNRRKDSYKKYGANDPYVLVYAIGNNENSCIAMTGYTHNLHGFHIEGWRSPWQYFFHEYKITHWKPLPPAPKEDTQC